MHSGPVTVGAVAAVAVHSGYHHTGCCCCARDRRLLVLQPAAVAKAAATAHLCYCPQCWTRTMQGCRREEVLTGTGQPHCMHSSSGNNSKWRWGMPWREAMLVLACGFAARAMMSSHGTAPVCLPLAVQPQPHPVDGAAGDRGLLGPAGIPAAPAPASTAAARMPGQDLGAASVTTLILWLLSWQ